MTVRKITSTTLSVVILITGFVFFRLYYVDLMSKLLSSIYSRENISEEILDIDESGELVTEEIGNIDLNGESGEEDTPDNGSANMYTGIVREKMFPVNYTGGYFPGLFYFCIIMIIIMRMIDAILNHRVAFGPLASFAGPLVATLLISVALCIEAINILQLWAIFYLFLILCLHSTFKKLIMHTESAGSYANLKLIKGFFTTIKGIVNNVISTKIKNYNNPADELIVLFVSSVVLLLEAIALISFIIYMATHWRLIFLSHLLNSF